MLRCFENMSKLRNHLKRNQEGIKNCIIKVKLDPNIWTLIRLKKNSEFYFIKKEDLKVGDINYNDNDASIDKGDNFFETK